MALLLLAGCGQASLEDADPNGWQACQSLTGWRQSNDGLERLSFNLDAGKYAGAANEVDIRSTTDHLTPGIALVDLNRLAKACEAHGVTIPEAVEVIPQQ